MPGEQAGQVDVLIVSHHGWNQSSSPALVDAIHARVAIMDNGAKKGGSTPVLKTIKAARGWRRCGSCIIPNEGGDGEQHGDGDILPIPGERMRHYGLELVGTATEASM